MGLTKTQSGGLADDAKTTINNNADNRVITGSGTANTLEGESNLTFTGSNLTITNGSGASEVTIVTPNNTDGGVYFNDGSNSGAINYQHSDNSMRFRVNATEKMRIDSAGDMGLGVSPNNVGSMRTLDIKGPSGEGAAIRLQDNGDTADSNDFQIYKNSSAAYLRVNGTDPLRFYLNGADRVLINSSGSVGIGTSSPSHKLHVESSASGVIAAKQTTNNGGFNTFEGKDSSGNVKFYASHNGRVGAADGIIFGSDTAAANILNDYEEGTWTPSFDVYGGVSGLTYNTQEGYYTKIGNFVFVQYHLRLSAKGTQGGAGWVTLTGLPFSSTNVGGGGTVSYWDNFTSNFSPTVFKVSQSSALVYIAAINGNNSTDLNHAHLTNSSRMYGTLFYPTAA